MGNTNSKSGSKKHSMTKKAQGEQPHHNKTMKQSTISASYTKPSKVVYVYAEWCTHCKNMEPKWEEMKDILEKQHQFSEGVIQKIENADPKKDKLLNEIDSNIKVEGFPTIFKKTEKGIQYYKGGPNTESLVNWVLEKPTATPAHQGGFQYSKTKVRSPRKTKSKIHSRKRHHD